MVDLAMLGLQLDFMILKFFSNLNNSMILEWPAFVDVAYFVR